MLGTLRGPLGPAAVSRFVRLYNVPAAGSAAPAGSSFDVVYDEVNEKLLRFKLPNRLRNLAYRPRRANELINRPEPIVFQGRELKPMTRKDPSTGDLQRLIQHIETPEQLEHATQVLQEYLRVGLYDNVRQYHLKTFVRQAAYIGCFHDAFTTVSRLRQIAPGKKCPDQKEAFRETLRVYAIISELSADDPSMKRRVYRVLHKFKRGTEQSNTHNQLLVIAGATNCYMALPEDATDKTAFREQIRQSVCRLKNSLRNEKVPTDNVMQAGKFEARNMTDYLLNIKLGLEGLERCKEIGVDVSVIDFRKLHRMHDLAARHHPDADELLPKYRERILAGYQLSRERGASGSEEESS